MHYKNAGEVESLRKYEA